MRTEWVCDVCSERFKTEAEANEHEALHGYVFVIVIGGKKYISRHAYIWNGEGQTLRKLPREKVAEEAMSRPDDYILVEAGTRLELMRLPIGAADLPQVTTPAPEQEDKK